MITAKQPPTTLAIFCKVVDNYGDIGICWRLARQWQREHGLAVTLWVDDLRSFRRICPAVTIDAATQEIEAVTVRHWHGRQGIFAVRDIADIVIEFFGCDIPSGYIKAMSERVPRAVWLNLEGLTAETWVEGCHTLPSPHPSLPLTKYFFFPGFNDRTGGLPVEAGLMAQRAAFQRDPAGVANFLARFGVTSTENSRLKISLFCYPEAPVAQLFAAWERSGDPIVCLIPEGVASAAVQAFLGRQAAPGASARRNGLTVRVLPFVPQPDYDKLLWACDLNFVRGEDSFVRAQWAAKPYVWHIYPQEENLHHKKLNAFLSTCTAATGSVAALSLAWNGAAKNTADGTGSDWVALWNAFKADMPEIAAKSLDWQRQLLANGDLASNILRFAAAVR